MKPRERVLELRALLDRYNYEYYHLISGVDLPIKTQDDIHDFFNKHKQNIFWSTLFI